MTASVEEAGRSGAGDKVGAGADGHEGGSGGGGEGGEEGRGGVILNSLYAHIHMNVSLSNSSDLCTLASYTGVFTSYITTLLAAQFLDGSVH